MPEPEPLASTQRESRRPLAEVARVFTRLGFTAFGGPAAHLAMFENEVVARRKWLDRKHFLDIVAAINFIPGPNSTELAIHLGWLRAGWKGLILGGFCFIAPAVLIILPIAWAYVEYGTLPRAAGAMAMINCAVVAIVAMAAWRFTLPLMKLRFEALLTLVCVGLALLLARRPGLQPELIVLAFAAVVGIARVWRPTTPTALPMFGFLPTLAAEYRVVLPEISPYLRGVIDLSLFLLKVGATLFGSGYVLVSYLRSGLVADYAWMTEQQLLDAIAVGQFTPGPLLTTATFVGYVLGHGPFGGGHVGGVIGAVAATLAIFLPSFVFVAAFGPILQKLRGHPIARGALDGMNCAVAGLLCVVTVQLAIAALGNGGWIGAAVLAAAAVALWLNVNATWVIVVALIVGVLR